MLELWDKLFGPAVVLGLVAHTARSFKLVAVKSWLEPRAILSYIFVLVFVKTLHIYKKYFKKS